MVIEGVGLSNCQSLERLKLKAQNLSNKTLAEDAKQFEAIFLQTLLKNRNMGLHFIAAKNHSAIKMMNPLMDTMQLKLPIG